MNRRLIPLCPLIFALVFLGQASVSGQTTATKQNAASGQAAKAPTAPKIEGETSLAKARAAVLKTVGTASFKMYLETYALALPLHDAISLCREFLPKAQAAQRADLASFAGSLALIAGRYEDAAFLFSQGTEGRADLILKAARSYLAAGNFTEAKKQLDLLPEGAQGKSYEGGRQLVLSWLFLLEGEPEKAFTLLQPLASDHGDAGPDSLSLRREALFILWLVTSTPDFSSFKVPTNGFDAKSVEAKLAAEFDGSLELALIRKGAATKPSAWLLSGLYSQSGLSGSERSMAHLDSPLVPAQAHTADSGNSAMRLQVGWFSRVENAQALAAKLAKLGFVVKMDEQVAQGGESRWAVIVDAQGDWSKTQIKLKDQGYESYLLP